MLPDGWEWIKLKYLVKYNVSTLEEKTNDDFNFDYIDIGSVEFGKGITDFQNMNFKNAPSQHTRCGSAVRLHQIARPQDQTEKALQAPS